MNPQQDNIKIIGLCGSLRKDSLTKHALNIALMGAKQMGAETALLELKNYQLVFCHGNEEEEAYPDDVHRLRQDVKSAHGIIIGTPEYHGSYSGVLKNALDLMSFVELEGKMIGLIGVSAGPMGAISALSSLRGIGRSLHAWVIPQQVAIPEVDNVFMNDGSIKDEKIEARLLSIGNQVAKFSFLHHSNTAQQFLNEWENAPTNPGGIYAK